MQKALLDRLDEAVRRADAWSEEAREAAAKARQAHASSAKELGASVNAPSHATVHETGGPHGGGSVSYAKRASHQDVHKEMTKGGFQRSANKRGTNTSKLGRSTAYTSSKVENSSYTHPHGHTATTKTNTPKYGSDGPMTYVDIHRHPGESKASE